MSKIASKITIKELNSIEQMQVTHGLVSQVYDRINSASFYDHLDEMIDTNNFKMIGAYSDGKLVGVAGYWVLMMFYCGRYLQTSNIIVDKKLRGQKIGTKMLKYLENKAKSLKCEKIILDSNIENKKSHSLYYGQDYYIRGLHFMKDL